MRWRWIEEETVTLVEVLGTQSDIIGTEDKEEGWQIVRHSSHQGGSPQNKLGDKWTCGMTLASAYVLCHLSAVQLQLQIKGRKFKWK